MEIQMSKTWRRKEHKSARHKGNCELARWELRGLDGDIAYFTVDILDKLSLRTKILRETLGQWMSGG